MSKIMQNVVTPAITYKDRLFRMIFSDKKDLLSLYNAVNNSSYDDPEELDINTLQSVIYMKMNNDLSFVIDAQLSLYEHQSTYNPNIPLRSLFYMADLYEALTKEANLYGKTIQKIPTPYFVTFYNGVDEQPERLTLKLSDAFEKREDSYALELQVQMLNVNLGHNKELLEQCKPLHDYAVYVETVRKYKNEYDIEEAVDMAIRECIDNDVLADFLRTHQREAKHMSIYEYDEEKHMRQEREEGRQEGRQEGRREGCNEMAERMARLIQCLMKDNLTEDLLRITKDGAYREQMFKKYNI